MSNPNRVITYIDGFNLYFGLREKDWRRLYWLDVQALSLNLLRPDQQLEKVHYFTSQVRPKPNDPHQHQRQKVYLEALATLGKTQLHFGHYLSKSARCRSCQATWQTYEEKMTDVNIAVELLTDAVADRFDTAILISGDSDLTGPVDRVRKLFPQKRVIVAFPPARDSDRLRRAANAFLKIGRGTLVASQLQDPVIKPDGFELHRPVTWI